MNTLTTYIEQVLSENSLADAAAWLTKSKELYAYLDRHVAVPQELERSDLLAATCLAGIRLLSQWKREREELVNQGLFVSSPVLIINDEWLDQSCKPPPPHVVLTIAKSEYVDRPAFVDPGGNDAAIFPFKALLENESGWQRVIRVDSDPDRPDETDGCWLVV